MRLPALLPALLLALAGPWAGGCSAQRPGDAPDGVRMLVADVALLSERCSIGGPPVR
jgi:hypothetical protein